MINTPSVSQMKSSPTPELRARAEAALQSGELKEASALALELSRHPSVRPWDKVVLGCIATANGEAIAAIKWLQAAQGELPEEGAVLVHLAAAFAAAKKGSHAASTLALAIAKRPEIADLHQHQGIYLSNAGQFSEADVAFERAQALEPNHTGVLTLGGERQISDGNLTDAKACFIRAIESDPSNGSALSNLALTHEREGDPDAALNVLSCLSEIHATAATDHRRGQILVSLGRLAEGWPCY